MAPLDGASDAVRLAVLVLASRTPTETGVVEIRTRELGRWLGLSLSYTASVVVPWLRRSGVVSVEVAPGEFGQDAGLRCRVLPLWAAQEMAGHPLALTKKEYATLWRLVGAVMAPGWTHRDGSITPTGLVGTRTGRGAATDRLALLLLVLEARESGRVRQCGGTVDTKRGRAAATVARLLGCTASAGERVLERLEDRKLVLRVRLETASGLRNRSRLMVPAVAAAHGCTVAADVQEERAQAPESEFSGPDVAAGPVRTPKAEADSQVSGVLVTDVTGVAVPDVAAALHTDHPHRAAPAIDLLLAGGFSGEGRGAEGRRPERACAGEDQPADGRSAVPGPRLHVAEDGPLRGEQPTKSPVDEQDGRRAAGADAGGWPRASRWEKAQQQRRVDLPADLRLRVALGPVAGLWERLSGWQQDQVEAAVKAELARLESLLPVPGGAPRLLAGRLTDRLGETGGEVMVTGPYGWLIRRGLVQRQACTDPRCDDGIRLDAATDCEMCANVLHMRRSRRAQICAALDQEQPGLSKGERRTVLESRMRRHADIEAQDVAWRREQAAEEEARRAMARAAAEEEAEVARAAAAVAEAVRQAQACEGCGRPQSSGRCDACRYEADRHELIREAEQLSAASVDPSDTRAVARAIADTRQMLDALTEQACGRYLQALESDASTTEICRRYLHALDNGAYVPLPDELRDVLAFTVRDTLQQALPQIRSSVLATLARSPEADAEASRAYRTEKRNSPYTGDHAADASAAVAGEARSRTARQLLASRLHRLRQARPSRPTVRVPWSQRLAVLAQMPLSDEEATLRPS